MPIVKVQKRGKITLPVGLRAKAGISEGDALEAKLERGKITLAPASVLGRQVAESLEDYQHGRIYGPFDTHEEFTASIKTNLKKRARSRR